MCAGLKVKQREKLTPHKYLVRYFKLELQFDRKITIKVVAQKHCLKLVVSEVPPGFSAFSVGSEKHQDKHRNNLFYLVEGFWT